MSPDNGEITVKTQLVEEGTMIRFSVEDEGCGVPLEMREKIFQPFVKMTDSSVAGIGLGLAISLAVVKSLGGTAGCGDREDGKKGACFWFIIPYKPVSDGEGREEEKDVVGEEGGGEGKKREEVGWEESENDVRRVFTEHSFYNLNPSRNSNLDPIRHHGPSRKKSAMMEKGGQLSSDVKTWFQQQRILIVEDNVVNEKMLRALLTMLLCD